MSYTTVNNIAVIDGAKGTYDDKVSNSSVKYGRNAAANYQSYVESYHTKPLNADALDFSNLSQLSDDQFEKKLNAANDSLSDASLPLQFKYKYLPETIVDPKNINKMALLGAAFEELGKKLSISTAELTEKMQKVFGEKMSAEALDINKDGQIDTGEYASSILLADMLSTDSENVDADNINGEINNSGQNNSLAYANKKNMAPATEMFKAIYNFFGLNQANTEFANEKSNLI